MRFTISRQDMMEGGQTMFNVMDAMSLKGKSALVTGGSRGIGKGIAIALAQAGADVVIMSKNPKNGEKTSAELKDMGANSAYVSGDVINPDDCQRAVDEVIKMFGKIDVLVNNAGIAVNVNAEDMSWSDWYDVMNVNLNGVFLMSQAAGREMIKRKSGSIINVSSISGFIVNYPQPQCSYNASKAAVNHLTKSLAFEWSKYNVRVNAIAPGYIRTDLVQGGLDAEIGKIWLSMTPMGRVGQPHELGGIAVYLASDTSLYTTGSIIVVDGAYSII